ncbi:UDP-N-acetylmuramate:L-alanyl-gamma-D-glutamyl-meso-diaminopimelate ligase [Moritella yayanosii]|uniref:UDP-N-acetylmuramate--L-alanyl-gamma-D-glutamyl-meso-2,6-diaminoheptandioate ligase n=1 Tax=Moritella yayanosii TaxID=69539 RepID=A0A330LTC1_9GAMM|nr:UDP-N-acetylmuramate:L-alanyl-gamma-D-glutamyl-meso-diaminopimelate ligase [Moritella yayanosii]SQD80100.1 UDP-N-acetylmuramate:L-alanyl-gamma-D-glutamyl-meso-diaminopimelate ligase [Moritella yayanosii]
MSKHIHILGICGTFMGGIAVLAKQLGYTVTGSDANVYPPMSTQLAAQGIALIEGYDPSQLDPAPDMVIVGNAMSRGNPCVEYLLNRKLAYTSGPQWLSTHLLQHRYVIAVSGTHGKTTTAAMVAWILEYAGLEPGFLIGGVPQNFTESARLGGGYFFVIEADEYDTAFFDKRSKFVHYQPNILIMNNLEYDHADIFPDLAAIQRQFHHVVRTVPSNGLILMPDNVPALDEVIAQGCWTPVQRLSLENKELSLGDKKRGSDGRHWQAQKLRADASQFEVYCKGELAGVVKWNLIGEHNLQNGMMAIAAAHYAGVELSQAITGLGEFKTPKRRMEVKGEVQGIRVYDDFAHHPTAIATTLAGLRAAVGNQRIIAVLEPRSNTMRMGTHQQALAPSLTLADDVLLYQPEGLDWALQPVADELCVSNESDVDNSHKAVIHSHIDALISEIIKRAQAQDGPCHVLIMSNGSFAGIHDKLLAQLK